MSRTETEGLAEAIRQATNPTGILQRIVDEALNIVPTAQGALVLLAGDDELRSICGSGMLAEAAARFPLDGSISGLSIRQGTTLSSDDVRRDPRANRPAARSNNIVSAVSVPLCYRDIAVGALLVASRLQKAFRPRDISLLTTLGRFISTAIASFLELDRVTQDLLDMREPTSTSEPASETALVSQFVANVLQPGALGAAKRRQRIESFLASESPTPCYQPVVVLKSGALSGVEALTRFPVGEPVSWFSDAHGCGLGVELELAAARAAFQKATLLPEGSYLAMNFSPTTLASREICPLLDGVDPDRTVLELTEHLPVEDYPSLRRAVATLRRRGFRLAIDDTGAGFASLSHIVELGPDIIKLDLELTRGIDRDPVRHSLATALVTFAGDIGATVVAEGIETEGELTALQQLGICYGQGYLIGRPAAPEEIALRYAS